MGENDVQKFMELTGCQKVDESQFWLDAYGCLENALNEYWNLSVEKDVDGGPSSMCFPLNDDDKGPLCPPPKDFVLRHQWKESVNGLISKSGKSHPTQCSKSGAPHIRKRKVKLEVNQEGGYVKIINTGSTVINLNNWSIEQNIWDGSSDDTVVTFLIMADKFEAKEVICILDPGQTLTIWSSGGNKSCPSAFDYWMPKKQWALGAVTTILYDTMKSEVYAITSNPLSTEIENDGTELQKVENGNLLVNELGTTNKEENVPACSRKRILDPTSDGDSGSSEKKRDKRE